MAVDLNDLIRAFEPILYFAPGERFYPSDCKRYLEQCIVSTVAPFDDRNSWHTSSPGASTEPIVHSKKISGRSDEPGTFLGESQGGAFPFLFATGSDEGFLGEPWIDGPNVAPGSDNRFAFLEQLNSLYNLPSSPADPLLHDSRFWYHAEAFDASRLRLLMASQDAPADFKALFPTLLAPPEDGAPLLLCYYLFFPGHDEPLENCPARRRSSHVRQLCRRMGVHLDSLQMPPDRSQHHHRRTVGDDVCFPVAVGLTSRNVGDIRFLGGEPATACASTTGTRRSKPSTRTAEPAKYEGLIPACSWPGARTACLERECSGRGSAVLCFRRRCTPSLRRLGIARQEPRDLG